MSYMPALAASGVALDHARANDGPVVSLHETSRATFEDFKTDTSDRGRVAK